jgi:tripartite-type tricarboxylate transporter receptor subunit TctC
MSADLVKKINDAVMAAVQSPEVQKRLSEIGVEVVAEGPLKFSKIVASEVDMYETLAREMNLQRQ